MSDGGWRTALEARFHHAALVVGPPLKLSSPPSVTETSGDLRLQDKLRFVVTLAKGSLNE